KAALAEIELQMIAVGADDRLGKAYRLISARPMECGFEYDLFSRVALRFIEARRGLGFAEHIGNAVVADAISGAEVGVGVVVEGAPADPPGVLRIGCKLIVDSGMAQCMLALPLIIVRRLGGIGMADKFGVE